MAVNVNVACSSIVWLPIAARTGATLTSLTVTVIVSKSVRLGASRPLSVTVMVASNVMPPCASVGVKLNSPELASMLIPAVIAAASRLNVRFCIGSSWSVAVAVKVSVACSSIV